MKTNNQIKGDLEVCCSATVAGRMVTRGAALIKGNLKVEGWLDAKNVRAPCKGLFADADALTSSYPEPLPGWWALVGNTIPARIYVALDRRWIDTGEDGGEITVDLDAYDRAIEEISDRVNDLRVEIMDIDHPVEVRDTSAADLVIADESANPIVTFSGGHIRTANFDSANISASASGASFTLPGKWCALGTSITAWDRTRSNGIYGYQYWLRKRITFAGGYVNKGENGYRMQSLANNPALVVTADYYTIEFGTNDIMAHEPPGTLADYTGNTGTQTFAGSMRIVIDRIYSLNPAALVILCTPRKFYYAPNGLTSWDAPNPVGQKLTDYVDIIRQIAAYESFPVADFFALSNTNSHNLAALSNEEAVHPNTAGHQLMANVLYEQFRLLYQY